MPFLCLSPSTQQIQQSKFAFFFFRPNLTIARQTKNCYYQKGTHTHTHTHQHRSLAVVQLVVEAPFRSLGAQLAPTSDERPGYRRWWAKKRERVRVQFEKTTVPAHWQSTVVVVVDSVVEPIGKQSSTEHTHTRAQCTAVSTRVTWKLHHCWTEGKNATTASKHTERRQAKAGQLFKYLCQ